MNQNKQDIINKLDNAMIRKNALLVEIARYKKHIDVLTSELVGEKEIIKKLEEELAWQDYQNSFS
jgi:hypothetical protein